MPGITCCVPGCFSNHKRDKHLKFYVFPRNDNLRNKWLKNIGRDGDIKGKCKWEPTATHRVCSVHFAGGEKTYMINTPTLFPLIRTPPTPHRKISRISLTVQPSLTDRNELTGFNAFTDTTGMYVRADTDSERNDGERTNVTRQDKCLSNSRMEMIKQEPLECENVEFLGNNPLLPSELNLKCEDSDFDDECDHLAQKSATSDLSKQFVFINKTQSESYVTDVSSNNPLQSFSTNSESFPDIMPSCNLAKETSPSYKHNVENGNLLIKQGKGNENMSYLDIEGHLAIMQKAITINNERDFSMGSKHIPIKQEHLYEDRSEVDGSPFEQEQMNLDYPEIQVWSEDSSGVFQKALGVANMTPGDGSLSCDMCGCLFSDGQCLKKHAPECSSQPAKYKCTICGNAYSLKRSSHNHMSLHNDGELAHNVDATGSDCEQGVAQNGEATGDQSGSGVAHKGEATEYEGDPGIVHRSDATRNQCDVCGKTYQHKYHLNRHAGSHVDLKLFECDNCQKTFASKNALKRHLAIHSVETQKFECDICGLEYSQKPNMLRHRKSHSNELAKEKPYSCHICGKRVTEAYHLTKHLRTHSGEKPYKCEICGKGFAVGFTLKKHIRIHTGERPYKCDICGKTFPVKFSLTTHLFTHSGSKAYSCELCGKEFYQKPMLNQHVKLH